MQLLIARHAETQWNVERRIQGWTNSTLTAHGTRQAQALAERLRSVKIDAIYSSDALRSVRTAECVALYQNLEVEAMTDLRETGWGEWEGMTGDEIGERFPELWHRFVARGKENEEMEEWETTTLVPGGESAKDCSQRIASALNKILARHTRSTERVMIVGHGGSLRYLFTEALGVRPGLGRRFHLDNTSLSEIWFTHDHPPVIRGLNDINHLLALAALAA